MIPGSDSDHPSFLKSFLFAVQGFRFAVRSERNIKVMLCGGALAVVAGLVLQLDLLSWGIIFLCCGVVISAELVNTAIETVVDLVLPGVPPAGGPGQGHRGRGGLGALAHGGPRRPRRLCQRASRQAVALGCRPDSPQNPLDQGIGPGRLQMTDTTPAFRSGFVALVGRPNAGKSTLVNACMGEKIAITSPVAQTTRRRMRAVVNTEASQLVIIDTPGLHKPKDALGSELNKAALAELADADVVAFLVDATKPVGTGDAWVASHVAKADADYKLLVVTKADIAGPQKVAEQLEAARGLATFDDELAILGQGGLQRRRLPPAGLRPPARGPQVVSRRHGHRHHRRGPRG